MSGGSGEAGTTKAPPPFLIGQQLAVLEQQRHEQAPDAAVAVEVRVDDLELHVQEPRRLPPILVWLRRSTVDAAHESCVRLAQEAHRER